MVQIAAIDKRVHSGAVSSVRLNYSVDKTFNVDGSTPLLTLLKDIKRYVGARKIKRLTLVAHGEVVLDSTSGGKYYTLEFCKELVQIYTANGFSLLAGCFASKRVVGIDIIACGSQDGSARPATVLNRALISQGIKMAQSIADAAGTVVRASPDTQLVKYKVRQDRSNPSMIQKKVTITPGEWEKRVWYFFPKKAKPFCKTDTGFTPVKR